jgi:hypothetical protein
MDRKNVHGCGGAKPMMLLALAAALDIRLDSATHSRQTPRNWTAGSRIV